VLALVSLFPWGNRMPFRELQEWPSSAVSWIEVNGLPSPAPWKICSGINEGSYLIWRLPGQALVHADTRGFYYPGDILEDSYYLPLADSEWQQRLNRVLARGSEYFLLPADCALWQKMKRHIEAPLFLDDKSVIVTANQVQEAARQVRDE
jgi:hypothetical protein